MLSLRKKPIANFIINISFACVMVAYVFIRQVHEDSKMAYIDIFL